MPLSSLMIAYFPSFRSFSLMARLFNSWAVGIAAFGMAASLPAQDPVIELSQGATVQAPILAERSDVIFVDLGYDVIAIPRDVITRIREEEPEAQVTAQYSHGENLYRSLNRSSQESVKTLVSRVSEAVVVVRTPTGLGSGFLIHPQGYFITNDHVVAGEHKISVTVLDRSAGTTERMAFDHVRILATSPEWDLALLKIEEAGDQRFQTVPLGNSDSVRQGQTVFAIGNPLGLEQTVSEGIVSQTNRYLGGRLFLQTTAQINPGNSGGPLFNLRGEVVGVNNMKVVAQGAEGLGFAIPSNLLKTFLHHREAFAFDPRNPNSGFRYNTPPTPDVTLAKSDVPSLEEDTPAEGEDADHMGEPLD